jgi:uncharacterized DUF497 family protein
MPYQISTPQGRKSLQQCRLTRLDKTTGRPYISVEDEFERDAAKAESNLVKHGVSFEAARVCSMMCLPGMVKDVILTVVYTERDQRTRIISARKATKHEQEEYYRSQTAE